MGLDYETNGKDFLRDSLTNNAVQNLIRLLFGGNALWLKSVAAFWSTISSYFIVCWG